MVRLIPFRFAPRYDFIEEASYELRIGSRCAGKFLAVDR